MSQYYSKSYRGLLVEQTDRGWIVPQMPNWNNGPISQGPYGTYQIACHAIDQALRDNSTSSTSTSSINSTTPFRSHYSPTFYPYSYFGALDKFFMNVFVFGTIFMFARGSNAIILTVTIPLLYLCIKIYKKIFKNRRN